MVLVEKLGGFLDAPETPYGAQGDQAAKDFLGKKGLKPLPSEVASELIAKNKQDLADEVANNPDLQTAVANNPGLKAVLANPSSIAAISALQEAVAKNADLQEAVAKNGDLYQYSLLGKQMGRVINLLNSPIIGKKSSFAFVSLLTGLGITKSCSSYSSFTNGCSRKC